MSHIALHAAILATSIASSALAQSTYTPLAFGPIGTAPAGTYYTNTADISADGRAMLADLSNGQQRYIAFGNTYTLSGTGFSSSISGDGLVVVGGQAGSNPQRWRLSQAVGSNIASENIPWPGGPVAFGNAIGTNGDGSVSALTSPNVSVVGPFGRTVAQTAFTAVNVGATAGAYRGLAASVPVMGILGSIPGNPTNGYRWNYSTGALSPLTLPAGASSLGVSTGGSPISADAGVIVGSALIGAPNLPYWWDAAGVGHAVPTLAGTLANSVLCTNSTGTLVGGFANFPLSVRHAFIVSLADNQVYDLHNLYSAAGLLPAGWTLTATQHISDDASRIFCLATAPDGSTRTMLIEGAFNVPTPGTAALLGLGGLMVARRRRTR